MNKFLITWASVILSLSANSQISTSKWLNTPLTIDGKDADWGNRPTHYSSEAKMFYELKNDSNYLFLVFELTDKSSQMRFMHAGFEIAMKVKTKPKLTATVNFLPQQGEEPPMQEIAGFNNPMDMQKTYILKSNHAAVTGFLKTKEIIKRNENNTEEFTYNIGWNKNNNMLIELQIPLSEVFETTVINNDYTQIPIRLTCKLNALERPSHGGQTPPGGSGMRGGMSGGKPRGGGGPEGHGGQGGPPSDMQTMNSAQTFKAKYYLSKKN